MPSASSSQLVTLADVGGVTRDEFLGCGVPKYALDRLMAAISDEA
jgi:hypothetical protein